MIVNGVTITLPPAPVGHVVVVRRTEDGQIVWRSVPPLKDPTFDAVPLHAAERFEWKGPVL